MGKKKGALKPAKNEPAVAPKKGRQAKTSAVDISHHHASRIRELLHDVDIDDDDAGGGSASTQALTEVYNDLLGLGFLRADVEAAMTALRTVSVESTLDWLCMNVPAERLPKRFAVGARSATNGPATRIIARAPAKSASETEAGPSAAEREAEARAWAAQQQRAAEEDDARRREEEAAAAVANKSRILQAYAQVEAFEDESDTSDVEDWELWGDRREIDRRRAERARAAQLNMASKQECMDQLAAEMATAMQQAKAAKATGNKEHKRVAGEVIKQVKLEVGRFGFKEADIHAIIARRFPSAGGTGEGASGAPAKGKKAKGKATRPGGDQQSGGVEGWPALGGAAAPPQGNAGQGQPQAQLASGHPSTADVACGGEALAGECELQDGLAAGGAGAGSAPPPPHADAATAAGCGAAAAGSPSGPVGHSSGTAENGVQGEGGQGAAAVASGAGEPAAAAGASAGGGGAASSDAAPEFDANLLWDECEALDGLETVKNEQAQASKAAKAADSAVVPLGRAGPGAAPAGAAPPKKGRPPPPPLPVCVPKAVLQQLCHKQNPAWLAPRFNKLSLPSDRYHYSCSITFPKAGPKARKRGPAAGSPGAAAASGTQTWQLPEDADGWPDIQTAQNAAALAALATLLPDLLQTYRLEPPFTALWERLRGGGGDGDADSSAERAGFIDSLLKKAAAEAQGTGRQGTDKNGTSAAEPAAVQQLQQEFDEPEVPLHVRQESDRMLRDQLAFEASPTGREWADKRARLPVLQVKDQLLSALGSGHYAVLSGDTGCGKTTQVPQYVLESEIAAGRGGQCQIVCTQPRRIAAISVAERVAQERAEPAPGRRGSRIGYHVRLDPAITPDTHLTFCTTGILLRRLAGDSRLADISHIIVDEVHERSLQGDFLLALLRRVVAARAGSSRPLKVVLMSATIDLPTLSRYFGNCPYMSAQGRTFPVQQFFLEDVYEMTDYRLEADSPAALRTTRDLSLQKKATKQAGKQARLVKAGWGDDEAIQRDTLNRHYQADLYEGFSKFVHINLGRVDESAIDFDLLEDLVRHVDSAEGEGAILVFLPGMAEIMNLVDRLNGSRQFSAGQHWILPLHSTVPPEDQRRVFEKPPAGVRKIVVSTNIAETSVTIEDVVFVIDSGKLKERRFNAARGVSMLVLDHVAKASARQRKGRAGRVREGKCYSLFTRECHDHRMPGYQVPEILRVPLDELVLQIHLLGLGKAAEFLTELLQPPQEKAIEAAVASLQVIGALNDDEVLTPLGTHLAQLPMEPRLGKLLVTAAFVGCLGDALTIAACLSYKSPFSTAFAMADAAELARQHLASKQSSCIASGQQSDHLVMLAAYSGWQAALAKGGARLGREYVKRHCLTFNTLQMLQDMRAQFASMLAEIRLVNKPPGTHRGNHAWIDSPAAPWNAHGGQATVVKAALCAALYPQVACMDSDVSLSKRPTWFDPGSAVFVHMSSVLHPLLSSQYLAPYLAFSEKMQTTNTFVRDNTVVPPMALLLFGGTLEVHHDAGYVLLDGWLKIKCAAQTAVLVKKLRIAWDGLLQAKVAAPQAPPTETQQRILETLVGLLNEGAT